MTRKLSRVGDVNSSVSTPELILIVIVTTRALLLDIIAVTRSEGVLNQANLMIEDQ